MKRNIGKLNRLILLTIILFYGCKQPETVIVNENPEEVAPNTNSTDTSTANQAAFRQLTMGASQSVESFDPLFAENLNTMQADQLIYEGLLRLNSNGTVVPAMAKKWSVSDDSLTYTFALRTNSYYHDNSAFSAGNGRKFESADVSFIFERMAKVNVPPAAAHLFMNIQGFEPFFQEQRQVYNPKDRTLKTIAGINTPNDSTVIFRLEKPDPSFLKKLATPFALIYPREAVGESVADFKAIGTGPFVLSRNQQDTAYTFSRFNNYHDASDIDINRVDLKVIPSAARMLQSMKEGKVQLIPAADPDMLQNLPDSLEKSIAIKKPGGAVAYSLRYFPSSTLTEVRAKKAAAYMASDFNRYSKLFPDNVVRSRQAASAQSTGGAFSNDTTRISIAAFNDDFAARFIKSISPGLAKQKIVLTKSTIHTATQNTALYFTKSMPLINLEQSRQYSSLFSFNVSHVVLLRTEIKNLHFNSYPWWLNLRGVTLPEAENIN